MIVPCLLGSALLVGLRHRSAGGALLLGTSAVLCATGPAMGGPEESVTLEGAGSVGAYREACGPAHRHAGGVVGVAYQREVASGLAVTAEVRGAVVVERALGESVLEADRQSVGASLQPMLGLTGRYGAIAAGAHVGRLTRNRQLNPAFPAARFRIGPRETFFVDGGVGDHFAGAWPSGWIRFGLGFGVPPHIGPGARWNHPVVRLGVVDSGPYGGLELGLGEQVRLDAFVSYADQETWRGALGIRWRPGAGSTGSSPGR
jgi:hypothetical protein